MSFRRLWLMLALAPAVFTSPAIGQTSQRQQYVVVYVEFLPAATIKGRLKLAQLAGLAHKSAGFVSFNVNQEIGRPNFYSLVEIWRNDKAYQDFLGADRTQALLTAIHPLLEAPLDERPGDLVK